MRSIEKMLVAMPWMRFVFQRWLIEIIARVSGSLLGTLLQKSRFGIERRVRGFFCACYFGGTGLSIDRNLQIEGHNALQLGDEVTLYGGSHFVAHKNKPITIGHGTHVARNAVLAGLGGISIGEDCAISSGVLIYSITQNVNKDPLIPFLQNGVVKAPVTIGNDVWIGAGATILPGVTIHDHAIIGAGSVVMQDIPAWQVAVGTPAKPMKDRRPDSPESPV